MDKYIPIQKPKTPKGAFEKFVATIKTICGLDLFKGLKLTLKEFLAKSVTIHYPAQVIPFSPRYRAVHSLQRLLESGSERCIGCGLCEKICTSNCIRIITHKGEDNRKKIDSYTINLGRCIYCGLCAEVCPELAIVMGQRFENTSEARAQFASKNELLKDINEAKNLTQLEFAGFGSVSVNADSNLKPTPIVWDSLDSKVESSEIESKDSAQNAESSQESSPESKEAHNADGEK